MGDTDTRHARLRLLMTLVAGLVVLAAAYGVVLDQRATTGTRIAQPPTPAAILVDTAVVRKGDIPVYLDGLGTVTAFNTVTVRSRVDGQLIRVAYQEGQLVREGDLLAEIDPRPFQVQLEQAQAQLTRDQAQLANAHVDLTRYDTLIQRDAIPKQQADTQRSSVAQLEGTVKADQAAIDSANLQVTYTRITAPISGRIGLRLVDVGNIVHATDTNGLLIITQVQPIAIMFTIAEDNLPRVLEKLNHKVPLTVEAWDRSRSKRLAMGRALTIDNQIDSTTGTFRVKAVFANADNALFPNQFVNARLLLETLRQQVLAPSIAIQQGPRGPFAYVVKPDSTVEVRQLQLGATEASDVIVQKGLSAGDILVTNGAERLQPGSRTWSRKQGT
jgi:membrane fusion protein, multidrug efflux system